MVGCPICGKSFKFVDVHLWRIHGICIERAKHLFPGLEFRPEEYRKKVSQMCRAMHSASGSGWGFKKLYPRERIACPLCGKLFETVIKNGKPGRKYCSLSCYRKAMSERAREQAKKNLGNPNFKEKVRQGVLRRYREDPSLKRRISLSVRIAMMKLPPESKEKLREAGKRTIEKLRNEGRLEIIQEKGRVLGMRKMRRNRLSSLERKIKVFLDLAGIPYIYNCPLTLETGVKFLDFLLTGRLLVIECDGERYHAEKESQDSERDAEILAKGYSVLRFHETEIVKEFEKVAGLIIRAYKNQSVVYRSWRYGNWELKELSTSSSPIQAT
jgi:very-short-patch-repair endonuclease